MEGVVRHHKRNATAVVRRNDGCRFQARRKAESKIIVNVKKINGASPRSEGGAAPRNIFAWGRVHDVQNLIFLKMINAKKMNCDLKGGRGLSQKGRGVIIRTQNRTFFC